jgi:hypothetical protein
MTFLELYKKWRGPLMEVGDSPANFLPAIGFEGDIKELAEQFGDVLRRAKKSTEPTLALIEVGIMMGAEWQDRQYRERVKVIEDRVAKVEGNLAKKGAGA